MTSSLLSRTLRNSTIATLLLASLAACSREGKPIAQTDTAKLGATPSAAPSATAFTRIGEASGFDSPESAVFDSTQNVWFVSNVAGDAFAKDHNGFISRLKADGTVDSLHFIKSGVNGALLDGPKGLALHGDTIWAADIDVARAFDRRTGKPLANVDLRPLHALLLNAIAVGPDGRVYITDTAIQPGPGGNPKKAAADKIFVIGPGLKPAIAVQDSAMEGADGISWDATQKRFIIVGFMGKAVTAWTPGARTVQHVASGVGQFDGCEWLPDGRTLVSSWADSSLYVLRGDSLTTVVAGGLPSPADLHVDLRTMRMAIPLLNANRVEFYQVPRAGGATR